MKPCHYVYLLLLSLGRLQLEQYHSDAHTEQRQDWVDNLVCLKGGLMAGFKSFKLIKLRSEDGLYVFYLIKTKLPLQN